MSDDNVDKEEGAVVGGQEGDYLNFIDSFNTHVVYNRDVKTLKTFSNNDYNRSTRRRAARGS